MVVDAPAADHVRALRQGDGGDIGVHGSIGLTQSLAAAGLVDEYRLVVSSNVAGPGTRLFPDDQPPQALRLIDATPTDGGSLLLGYAVARTNSTAGEGVVAATVERSAVPVELPLPRGQGGVDGAREMSSRRAGTEEERVNAFEQPPPIVRWTLRLEDAVTLDRPVQALEPLVQSLFGTGTRASVLRGEWLGHAVHPLLTDVVLGTWTSASILDVLGGSDWSAPAQSLVGTGLLAAGPTAWTGWAEWSAAGPRDKRVGLVHAVTNGLAISIYAASWMARRRGRHATGARLALLGAAVSGAGAYLGGHLTEARKVASHHPAYANATQLA